MPIGVPIFPPTLTNLVGVGTEKKKSGFFNFLNRIVGGDLELHQPLDLNRFVRLPSINHVVETGSNTNSTIKQVGIGLAVLLIGKFVINAFSSSRRKYRKSY